MVWRQISKTEGKAMKYLQYSYNIVVYFILDYIF